MPIFRETTMSACELPGKVLLKKYHFNKGHADTKKMTICFSNLVKSACVNTGIWLCQNHLQYMSHIGAYGKNRLKMPVWPETGPKCGTKYVWRVILCNKSQRVLSSCHLGKYYITAFWEIHHFYFVFSIFTLITTKNE